MTKPKTMTNLAHKIKLRPNAAQTEMFWQHAGYARYAYNWAWARHKEIRAQSYEAKERGDDPIKWPSAFDLNKQFNIYKKTDPDMDWHKDLFQGTAMCSILNFGKSVDRWMNKKLRAGAPKKKRKYRRDSFVILYSKQEQERIIDVEKRRIYLSKIGWVKMFELPRFSGMIKSIVINKLADGWYASILIDHDGSMVTAKRENQAQNRRALGVDVGIKTLAVCSDGRSYPNPRSEQRYRRKIRMLNKQLDRRKHGSNRWLVTLKLLRKTYFRMARLREHTHHVATTDIVMRASSLGIEDLNVAGMLRNRRIAKALSDASLGGFLHKLEYKSALYGTKIVSADRFYPSSKTCSSCGWKNAALKLSDRSWTCRGCGKRQDRDLNAAINLKRVAVNHSETKNGRGERVRPAAASQAMPNEASTANACGEKPNNRGSVQLCLF